MMSFFLLLSGFFLLDLLDATVDIYQSSYGCSPPSLSERYMGGPAVVGKRLNIFVNDKPLSEFNGYKPNETYEIEIKSPKYEQYSLWSFDGSILDSEATCESKQLNVVDVTQKFDFQWMAPSDAEYEKKSCKFVVGYASSYSLVAVQHFELKPFTIIIDPNSPHIDL